MGHHPLDSDPARLPSAAALDAGAAQPHDEGDEMKRAVRDLLPWAIAVLLHAAMVLVAILVVWATLPAHDEEEPIINGRLVSPQTQAVRFNNSRPFPKSGNPQERRSVEKRETNSQIDTVSSVPVEDLLGIKGSESSGSIFSQSNVGDSKMFGPPGGGGTTNAKSFAFVIDASGSMVDTMPFVIAELKRSLRNLREDHTFTVLFYQNGQVIEPLTPGLKTATPQTITAIMDWLDEGGLAPSGLTSPLPAIQTGLKYKPDLMYLLSDNITGRGIYEINQSLLLTQVKQANVGKTKINTIQFLYPDPLERYRGMRGTMVQISEQSGGLNRFVRASDIWMDGPLSQ